MPLIANSSRIDRIKRRFFRLYGDDTERCMKRLMMMVGAYGVGDNPVKASSMWNEKDVLLITYGDSIRNEEDTPLSVLKNFCDKRLKGAIKLVHILPFCPWTSDDGFSVKDYREVDPDLGTWKDVENLSNGFDLMFRKTKVLALQSVRLHSSSKRRTYTLENEPSVRERKLNRRS